MAHPDRRLRALLAAPLALTIACGSVACSSSTPDPAPSLSTSTKVPANVYEQQRIDGVNTLLKAFTAALTSGDRGKLDALIDPLASPAFRQSLYAAQDDLGPTPKSRAGSPSSVTPTPIAPTSTAAGTSSTSDPGAVTVSGSRSPESSAAGSSAAGSSAAGTAKPAGRGQNLVLRTLDYRVAPGDGPERLIGGALGVKLTDKGSSDSWVTPVTVSYALGGTARPGVDEPVIDVPTDLAFARYGEEWKLLGDGSLSPDPSVDPEAPVRPPLLTPWAFGGLRADDVATAGGVSAVLSYPGTDITVERVRRELGPAVAAVTDFWGDQWSRRAVLMATGDDDQWAGFTQTRTGATDAAAAATVFARLDRGTRTVTGQRIVLAPSASQLSNAGIAVLLRHELTHVATRFETPENAPMWLTEGVAEYVGRRVPGGANGKPQRAPSLTDAAPELAAEVAGGNVPKSLPDNKEFAVADASARLAYQSAWSFAAFVAEKYGDNRLRDLYRAVSTRPDAAGVNSAMTSTLGVDQRTAIEQWQTWLRRQVR